MPESPATAGRVCTVSTVKDTLPGVRRFVTGNLAGGVDHMFVVLDAPEPAVEEWLAGQEHVTAVLADDRWWRGARSSTLNDRQRMNANAIASAVAEAGCADWLFHLDGDEVAQIDRDRLAAAPADARAARLGVLEAVARPRWDDLPTWFKRPLAEPELTLLVTLGVIDKPRNGAYFHGHAEGKVGIRPGPDAWLTLHDPVDDAGHELATYVDDGLRVLHYESYSGEEFARKWMAMASAGQVRFRPARQATHVAVKALLERSLDDEVTERYLMRIFAETTVDDLDTLRELGLLVEADPRLGMHRPAGLDAAARSRLAAAMDRVAAVPKARFRPPVNRPVDPADAPAEPASPPDRAARLFRRRT